MAKKVYTIDVDNKNLKVSAKPSETKAAKVEEKKNVEVLGVVEINNASAAKKVKNKEDKGFEKNVVCSTKKSVKKQTSKVDDYFDFSFKTEKTENVVENKEISSKQETPVLKSQKEEQKIETAKVVETVKFDSEVSQVIRVARIGSLFDCEKRMINA